MKHGISNMEVKKLNRNRVFRYVNGKGKTSMPDISADLGMSGPTVLQIIKELKELGIVEEVGEFESTGGRKAKAIAPVQDACYAVGVDITRNHISMVLTNLSKQVLKHIRIRKPFVMDEAYLEQLNRLIEEFCIEDEVPREQIIGVGLSIPGIVDAVNSVISYSHVLGIKDIDCKGFRQYLTLPYIVINDANAAAITEYAGNSYSGNLVYLSLSNTVGGGIIFGKETNITGGQVRGYDRTFRNMYVGNQWRSGEFGHVTLHSKGPECYCGKRGCLDVYCSSLRLAGLTDGNLERFFTEMEDGNEQYWRIWEEYMDNLVVAADNLHMSFDCDVILGGYVGSHMEPYIEEIQKKAASRNIFGQYGGYLRACKYKVEASALGAALYQIEKYIDTV